GLTSEPTYHYRVVAGNANGASIGQDRTFTPHWVPNLTTEPATQVQATSAVLNGSYIGINGVDTKYYFQYGTDTSYEHTTSPEGDNGSAPGPQAVGAVEIAGLQ